MIGYFFIGFGIVFINIGTWVYFYFKGSEEWPTANGLVLISQVITGLSDGRRRYEHKFRYEYSVEKVSYTNHVYSCDTVNDTKASAEKMVDRYPEGSKLIVHYNPKNPKRSMIIPGSGKTHLFLIGVGFVLLLVGGGMAIKGI